MKIGIIGLGNMGSALLNLLCKNGYEYNLILSDIRKELIDKKFWSNATEKNIKTSDIIFLTVKPKDTDILKHLKESNTKLIVSCIAGLSLKDIEKYSNIPTIRIMANIPIEDRKGTIVYIKNKNVMDDKLKYFLKICRGPKIIEMTNEKKLDISTVMAGSMPAFISYLSEEYIKFGMKNGLTKEESLYLYTSSVEGTMNMLKRYSEQDIINKVSSPGGVTAEGIKLLKESNIHENIKKSLQVSYQKINKLKD